MGHREQLKKIFSLNLEALKSTHFAPRLRLPQAGLRATFHRKQELIATRPVNN